MDQPTHITPGVSGYRRGCRCPDCATAQRDRMRSYQRRANGCREKTTCRGGCGRETYLAAEHGLCWKCQRKLPHPRFSERQRAARRRLRAAAKGKVAPKNWPWCSGDCARCGEAFTRKGTASPYCSGACSKKARRSLRRTAIFERDNFVCQICFEPADPEAHYLSDWYPTVDHIVPRNRGGGDEPENLRCAHRWCNSVRGDLSFHTDASLRVG